MVQCDDRLQLAAAGISWLLLAAPLCHVKQSSLGHAVRSLYLVAIAEGECGECFRSGEELELPYMRVSFHRRDQRLSRSRL